MTPKEGTDASVSRKTYGRPSPRLIYPDVVHSEQIRELAKNPLHLLVWYSLFHGLDDQGRMECRVSTILTSCLGHLEEGAIRPKVVQEALHRMSQIKDEDGIPLIYIYEANSTKIIQMAKWWDWQNGMRNSWPSRWEAMPGWVDDIRGHGRRAMEELIASRSGDDGGTIGGRSSLTTSNQKVDASKEASVKPWDLFQAYLDVRGISHTEFPSPRIQLRHAKLMIRDRWTPEMVKEATAAFEADPYWSVNGFDLATLTAHWGKMKNKGKGAKKQSRPIRTLDQIEEEPPPQ